MSTDKNMLDEIARVAYGLFENRGCAAGNDFSDWLEAERIVKQKYAARATSDIKNAKSNQPVASKPSARSKPRGQINRPSPR